MRIRFLASILVLLILVPLVNVVHILSADSAQITPMNINETIVFNATLPLVYYDLIYQNYPIHFFENTSGILNLVVYYNASGTFLGPFKIVKYSTKLYSVYQNKTLEIPTNSTALISESAAQEQDKVILAFIGTKDIKGNSSILYYSTFDGTNWSPPSVLLDFGYSMSVYTNGTYILDLWKPYANSSKLYLLVFNNHQLIANYSLSPTLHSGLIITSANNLVVIANSSITASFQDIMNLLKAGFGNVSVYIFSLGLGKIIKKVGDFTFAQPVYNSSEYFIAISTSEAGLLLQPRPSYVYLYNVNGSLVNSWEVGYPIESVFMRYPNIIAIQYVVNYPLQIKTYEITLLQVKKNNTWYNYTQISMTSEYFQTSSSIVGQLMYLEAVLSDQNKLEFLNTTTIGIYGQYNVSWLTLKLMLYVTPSFYTLYFSKPPKPILNVTSISYQGYTILNIRYLEENYSEYGVQSIGIYVNGSLVKQFTSPSGYVIYNVTKNGTYIITAVAINVFGNSSATQSLSVQVQPLPIQVNTTTSTTTSSSSTTTSTYSTSSSPSSSTSSSTSTSSPTTIVTKENSYNTYLIIGIVIVIVIVIALVLYRRR